MKSTAIFTVIAIVIGGWLLFDKFVTKAKASYLAQCSIGVANNKTMSNAIEFTEGEGGKKLLKMIYHATCECMTGVYASSNGGVRIASYELGLLGSSDLSMPGQQEFDDCGKFVSNDPEFHKRLTTELKGLK